MSGLKNNDYKDFKEFVNDYHKNSFNFSMGAEEQQNKHLSVGQVRFSSGYYRAFANGLIKLTKEESKHLAQAIKILGPIWLKERNGIN